MYDIIIPTYNMRDKISRCLQFIKNNTARSNYRIILIDNNSEDTVKRDIRNYLKQNEMKHYIFELNENLGFVKAVNIGLAFSTAPWVVLLNNDVYVSYDWLSALAYCADENKYDIIGPLTSPNAGSHQSVTNIKEKLRADMPVYTNYNLDKLGQYANIIRNKFKNDHIHIKNGMIAFFCVAIRRKVIKDIGYLSECFGIGFGDDDDYSLRATRRGYRLGIDLSTFVHHDHRSTFKSMFTEIQIKEMQAKALADFKERARR